MPVAHARHGDSGGGTFGGIKRKGNKRMSLSTLKALNVERILELDEAVWLSTEAEGLKAGFETHELEVPEWLEQSIQVLNEEIAKRTRAADLAAFKEAQAEVESLRSASEKKARAQARIEALGKKLGLAAKAAK